MSSDDMRPLPGRPFPLGATPGPYGTDFAIWGGQADGLDLLLYDAVDDDRPARTFTLDPRLHRTGRYWHVHVPDARHGQLYGWRARGPHDPARGARFDADKLLLDPYARCVAMPTGYSRAAAALPGRNDGVACKAVVADPARYDWEGDAPLGRPFAQTVIYELHVGGFTRHPSSGVAPDKRGSYAGLVEKIPYLVELGITAVELLPVFAFDPHDAPPGLVNHWGYAPISFFAPHGGYAARGMPPVAALDEFRDMVKALHRAGIEVILDVVYNHTAEGGDDGPTISWRGLDDGAYYLHDAQGRYADYSGCGNTLNANHAVVRRMIRDSLHWWVQVMHVDGFRFDLASILSRDAAGRPLPDPPVLADIDTDPVLAGTKLIAEAWDAGGLYQVGRFAGERWKEWNGCFRDDVRAFVRGDAGMVRRLADRVLGSPDLYGERPREPAQSINFVTCHDGFTLADLVSHDRKHNEANLEGNRDGSDHNLSWNCGIEGPTDDAGVNALRERQARNLLAITLLSLGTPMLLMGDEIGRTQLGNNNAYCQDNEISWLDWRGVERHAGLLRFVRGLIRIRFVRESVRFEHQLTLAEVMSHAHVQLHGVQLDRPDHSHESHSLAITASSLSGSLLMHFALNAWWHPLDFDLPALPAWATGQGGWRRVIDTSRPSPGDLCLPPGAESVTGSTHRVGPRSVVMLIAGALPTDADTAPAARAAAARPPDAA
ncbi:MAG: glycogen debranching protein GlgX [Rubrivivax sp.]|jgi:glycogen operon protein|nr:glycogen debranching protein GlgX [Rubrivivax sp.]